MKKPTVPESPTEIEDFVATRVREYLSAHKFDALHDLPYPREIDWDDAHEDRVEYSDLAKFYANGGANDDEKK